MTAFYESLSIWMNFIKKKKNFRYGSAMYHILGWSKTKEGKIGYQEKMINLNFLVAGLNSFMVQTNT